MAAPGPITNASSTAVEDLLAPFEQNNNVSRGPSGLAVLGRNKTAHCEQAGMFVYPKLELNMP